MRQRYLLAIPVFNEEKYVRPVLAEARERVADVLVVDDGSTDRTAELLAGEDVAVVRHAENRGYGASLVSAFRYAMTEGFDWLITMDCDEQHEPAFIPKFIEAAESDAYDIVSGSRYLDTFNGDDVPPADRRAINVKITRMLNDRLNWEITDAFCGFKAYRVSALEHFNITVPGYAMPLQFWVQAWRAKLRIAEVSVRLIYNDPNRHFGGVLDDPTSRYKHYVEVFEHEMCRGLRREAVTKCGASVA